MKSAMLLGVVVGMLIAIIVLPFPWLTAQQSPTISSYDDLTFAQERVWRAALKDIWQQATACEVERKALKAELDKLKGEKDAQPPAPVTP